MKGGEFVSNIGNLLIEIFELYEKGHTKKFISKKLDIPVSMVNDALKTYYANYRKSSE